MRWGGWDNFSVMWFRDGPDRMSPYEGRVVSDGTRPGGGSVVLTGVRVPGREHHASWYVRERRSVGCPAF